MIRCEGGRFQWRWYPGSSHGEPLLQQHRRAAGQNSIKLDTVASDILGSTGRAIIEGLIAGEQRPYWLADKAQGTLRSKRNQLRVVLRGHVTEHVRWMLRRLMEELKFLENEILCLEQQLARDMEPYQAADFLRFLDLYIAKTRSP